MRSRLTEMPHAVKLPDTALYKASAAHSGYRRHLAEWWLRFASGCTRNGRAFRGQVTECHSGIGVHRDVAHQAIEPAQRPKSIRIESNLCFDSAFPVVAVEAGQRGLSFTFDTGATITDLYARFGREFPELVKAGRKDSAQRTGAGGTVRDDVVVMPELHIRVGSLPGLLRSVNMYPNENSPWHGNLGMDLLREARVVTIDFGAMRLTLSQ